MKIKELKFNDFHIVRSLFTKSEHLEFTIDAVIAGNSPMHIWVDETTAPKSAFLWDKSHCYYLVGETENSEFCEAITTLLYDTIMPDVIARNHDIFKIEYFPNEWEPILEEILREKCPIKAHRKFFILDRPLISQWKDIVPSDFSIQKIDRTLLESDIENVNTIIDEIKLCWQSVDDFLQKGFGFCLIHTLKERKEVQGWCTGEYFSEGKCGIGIETFQGYQKRGFGTAMALAYVEHSLSVKIQPYWDVSTNNDASIRVAKKVGFKKIQDYTVFLGSFTNIESFQGNHYYQEKDYEKAAKWYEKAAKSDQRKFYNYYNAACSWALNGNIDSALNNLNKSLDFMDKSLKQFIDRMKRDTDLVNLYGTKGWKNFLKRLNDIEKGTKQN
ncbi:MAG: GNAT family N-acetyltransferase [Promethearchaeota archaeon]